MTRKTNLLALVLSGAMVLGACGNQDDADASEFRQAVPTSKDLTLSPPGTGGGSALIGQPALYGLLTAGVAIDVNVRVGWTATVLRLVTLLPPAQVSANSATWGPYVNKTNKIGWELEVVRKAPRDYSWTLFATPPNGQRTETARGTSTRGATFADYQGTFTVLLDTFNQLDSSMYASTGRIEGVYQQQADQRSLVMDFVDYVKAPGKAKNNWKYDYLDRTDGSGVFKYDALQDLQNNGSAEETYKVTTQWSKGYAGRSDASISGGDVTTPIDQIECWDAKLKRTYWKNPAGLVKEEGDAQSCVF
jgi:hypothetical protein